MSSSSASAGVPRPSAPEVCASVVSSDHTSLTARTPSAASRFNAPRSTLGKSRMDGTIIGGGTSGVAGRSAAGVSRGEEDEDEARPS